MADSDSFRIAKDEIGKNGAWDYVKQNVSKNGLRVVTQGISKLLDVDRMLGEEGYKLERQKGNNDTEWVIVNK